MCWRDATAAVLRERLPVMSFDAVFVVPVSSRDRAAKRVGKQPGWLPLCSKISPRLSKIQRGPLRFTNTGVL
jgi:hypothetical protein